MGYLHSRRSSYLCSETVIMTLLQCMLDGHWKRGVNHNVTLCPVYPRNGSMGENNRNEVQTCRKKGNNFGSISLCSPSAGMSSDHLDGFANKVNLSVVLHFSPCKEDTAEIQSMLKTLIKSLENESFPPMNLDSLSPLFQPNWRKTTLSYSGRFFFSCFKTANRGSTSCSGHRQER